MKTIVIFLSVLTGIINGDFDANKLSGTQQDSILAIGSQPSVVSNQQSAGNVEVPCTRYRLEKENEQKIFRHSEVADWYVIDTLRKTRKALGAGLELGKVRDAQLSPNGRYVAFIKDNNLYLHKLDFGTEVAVTKETDTDIISGVADWLYEEEFSTTALYAWSPDSKKLAFVRLDEHEVPTFSWSTYLGSQSSESTNQTYPQYTSAETLRYPKAGCANAKARVCVYDVATKAVLTMQVNNQEDDVYFPRLRWTKSGELLVLKLNRDQTKMEVLSCNAKSTVSQLLYKEESKDFFVDYELFDEWQWLGDDRFVVLSEKDGWRRAYLYNAQGIQQKALTPEKTDVTAIYGVDETTQTLYYQAAPTPSTRQLYAVDLKKGQNTKLTDSEGTHSARFSDDYKKMIDCYQSFTTPNTYTLYSIKGAKATKTEVVLDNTAVKELWEANKINEPQMLQIPNSKGQKMEAMLLSPITSSPSPLVVMHYSGPQSQRVLNRWRKKFEYALVAEGYAVLIVDTRGTDCKGRAWRNETYMELGQKEAEDLIAAANWAAQQEYIDGSRMAIMGWSYGGYQTLMTMSRKNHPFKAGVAIAPVTDWRLYDSAYTERYMRRPQVNEFGYKNASLLNKAADLTGNVLIIHGTGDDNVHVQHTMQYIDALVRADKQFEMQLYPDDNHQLKKGNNAKHMHERILNFLQKNL